METVHLNVGAGKAPLIFPEGYFPWERFGGVHDEVCVRALIIKGENEIALIDAELPSLKPYSIIDDYRKQVSEKTGIPFENVWVCTAHNVSAPHVPPADDPAVNASGEKGWKHQAHIQMVRDAIDTALEQAMADLRPAVFGAGCGEACVNVNRDMEFADGWSHGIEGTGPSDKAVTLVRFDDTEGHPIASLFSYATKSAVMDEALQRDGFRYVTSELTGTACRIAEKEIGAPVLYFMGAAGDQVPRKKTQYNTRDENGYPKEVNFYEKGWNWVEELGRELSRGVLDAWKKAGAQCDSLLQGIPMLVTRTAFPFKGQKGWPGGPTLPMKSYTYVEDGEKTVDAELFCIGDAVLVGLKPEITSLVGMMLRQRSPFRYTLIISMVNGGMNYMADQAEYDRYIFEATHSVLWKGTAEQFVDKLIPVLRELKDRMQ